MWRCYSPSRSSSTAGPRAASSPGSARRWSIRSRSRSTARPGRSMAAVGSARPQRAGVHHHLSGSDPGLRRLVLAAAQAGPHRPGAPHHLDRRPHQLALRQEPQPGRPGHPDRGHGDHALYRAAAAVGDPQLRGHLGQRVLDHNRVLGRHRPGRLRHPVRHAEPRRERASPRRRRGNRRRGDRQALRPSSRWVSSCFSASAGSTASSATSPPR